MKSLAFWILGMLMLRMLWLLCLAGSLWTGSLAAKGLSSLTATDLQVLETQGAIVVDIRTPEEWRTTGVIPGSHPLTFYDRDGRYDLEGFSKTLNQIAPNHSAPIVLVCRSGHRSGEAGQMLAAKWPDRQILHLGKGISEWIREGKATASTADQKAELSPR